MRLLFFSVILSAALGHPVFAALSSSDFFCEEKMPFGPVSVSYAKAVKSCGDKTIAEANICAMVANCSYISDEAKKTAKSPPYGKPFDRLTDDQKKQILHAANSDPMPTTLTCPEKDDNGHCPLPENCKGDVFYNSRPAHFTDQDLSDYNGRGTPLYFQPGSNPQPPAAGSAP